MTSRFRTATICAALALLVGSGSAFAFGNMGMGGGKKSAELPANEVIKVDKAKGSDAQTVADLFAKSDKLDKKKVAVRGKVVKVSSGIMGKNWVHLKDGTGEGDTGKIVATTQDSAEVGDVVTAKGTLYKDKDFGAGYFYKAIIEEATISK